MRDLDTEYVVLSVATVQQLVEQLERLAAAEYAYAVLDFHKLEDALAGIDPVDLKNHLIACRALLAVVGA